MLPDAYPYPALPTRTVKRADLFGAVTDTFATEAELNGFRPTQGAFLDRDAYKRPPAAPANQGALL